MNSSSGGALIVLLQPLSSSVRRKFPGLSIFDKYLGYESRSFSWLFAIQGAELLRRKNHNATNKVIDFDFVDITNLKSPKDGHIKKLSISLPDDSHMVHDWTFDQDGKEAHAIFHLERIKDTFDPASTKVRPKSGQSTSKKG